MNSGPDIPGSPGRDPDAALTPEERAMAERIARASPQREPSAALDASILAAARDAVAPPVAPVAPLPRERPRARRRWPVAAGVAATLVLAVGIAWQLRPVDDTHVEYSEAPRAVAVPAPGPGGPQANDESRTDDTMAVRETTPPAPEMAPAQASDSESTPVVEEPKKPVPQGIVEPQEAPAEPAVVFDEPSPMDSPAAPPSPVAAPSPMPVPPPPPAPPAASMAQSAPAAEAATSAAAMESKARAQRSPVRDDAATAGAAKAVTATGNFTVEPGRARTANEADAADAADARALDRVEVTGSRIESFGDQPLDDEPPASADSPQVQQAWLQRVRQLVTEHRLDAARDSLREYQRRYPDARLPDDLRALLVE